MSLRVMVSLAGALALALCFVTMRDVPHNPAIRHSGPSLTILWVAVSLVVIPGILALILDSKKATIVSLVASGLGIFVSLVLSCV